MDKQIKVLIVEDDPDQIMLYLEKLRIEGLDIIATDNEKEAMELLKSGGFDIVLLDILLESENGLDILKSIRQDKTTKNIKVAMFTNYAAKEGQEKARELGVVDFIIKSNITPKEVAQRIKDLLGKARKK